MNTNILLHVLRAAADSVQSVFRAGLLIASALFAFGIPQGFAAVDVASKPLIVQESLPPNMLLLLDDSGSMERAYMPDGDYLADTSDQGMQSSSVNFIYYDPGVTYDPPVQADGASYPPVTTFPNLPLNGFNSSSDRVDVTTYYSKGGYNYETFPFFRAFCPSGTTQSEVHYGSCYSYSDLTDADHVLIPDYGDNPYYYQSNGTAFVYTIPDGSGGYVEHYVAANCGNLPSAAQGNCQDDSATLQNVGNWFGYYRTRMLAAKSGLMNGFADLDQAFRVGFASINGNRADLIRSSTNGECGVTFSDSCTYGFATDTRSNNELAGVATWGDGSSGTRKAQFWNWLESEYGSENTPLRETLDAAGRYYSTGQPWKSQDDNGDSHEFSCRQSYTILTSDGFWNEVGDPDPSVGNADGSDGPTITGPNDRSLTYEAALPYADNSTASPDDDFSNTLADVAVYYWKNDLRTALDNQVPTTDEDPAFWQHMTTFAVGLGYDAEDANGNVIDGDAVFDWANGGTPISGFAWPEPSSGSINNIADMLHAAVNGHGGFYSAKNPQEFAKAISDSLGRAAERVGSGSSLAANSTRLETGTVTYQANYYTGSWKGDLRAYPVGLQTKQIGTSADWSAADNLPAIPDGVCVVDSDTPVRCPSERNIIAYDSGNSAAVAFTVDNFDSQIGADVVRYLRGDSSNEEAEGGSLRNRDTALGDIVNSQPVYVGSPNANLYTNRSFDGAQAYGDFYAAQAGRHPIAYVAANDGMLHGFDAETGEELYAFLPASVIDSGVTDLTDPSYGTSSTPHQFFNDGELTVADVYVPGYAGADASGWATILVGTTGRGPAKAVYALDVTDPSDIRFLWERSSGDGLSGSDYIGQVVGQPLVVQVSDQGTSTKWEVLVGNGYNSSQNKAALLHFDVLTGDLTVSEAGTDTDNGLAAPATFDTDEDGVQEWAYAGDLLGNVWEFDLDKGSQQVIFQTEGPASQEQPITAGLLLGKESSTGDLWAFFGTGKYLGESYRDDLSSIQSWYGIVVQSSNNKRVISTSDTPDRSPTADSALVERFVEGETAATNDRLATRVFTKGPDLITDGNSPDKGWFIDLLPSTGDPQGERMVVPNQFQGSVLLGTSLIPEAVDVCNPSGRGYIMGLNPFQGTNVAEAFVDANGDGQVNAADKVTIGDETYAVGAIGFSRIPNAPIFVGSTMLISFDDGSTASVQTSGGGTTPGRMSWREIVGD